MVKVSDYIADRLKILRSGKRVHDYGRRRDAPKQRHRHENPVHFQPPRAGERNRSRGLRALVGQARRGKRHDRPGRNQLPQRSVRAVDGLRARPLHLGAGQVRDHPRLLPRSSAPPARRPGGRHHNEREASDEIRRHGDGPSRDTIPPRQGCLRGHPRAFRPRVARHSHECPDSADRRGRPQKVLPSARARLRFENRGSRRTAAVRQTPADSRRARNEARRTG